MSDTRQHYDCEHEQCDHAAKPEYGNRFCGVHKGDYYKEHIGSLDEALAKLQEKHRTAILQGQQVPPQEDKPPASMLFLYAVASHTAALIIGAAIAYMVVKR